jgi:hypothetical protein
MGNEMNLSSVKCVRLCVASILVSYPLFAVADPQSPPSAPVTVVNTDANPVPVRAPSPLPVSGSVTISGIPSVNINNTPSVLQAGIWNVGILGIPAVSQSGTWNVGIVGTPSFSLVTPTTPIPVTVNAPARTIIQFTAPLVQFPANTIATSGLLYHNASSKTLVIEGVSMSVESAAGTIGGAALTLTTVANGISAQHHPLQVEELPGNGRFGAQSAAIRLYADPGTDIRFGLRRGDTAGTSTVEITFSGYLTDTP